MISWDNFYQIEKIYHTSRKKSYPYKNKSTTTIILNRRLEGYNRVIFRSIYCNFSLTGIPRSTRKLDIYSLVTIYTYPYFKDLKEGDWLFLDIPYSRVNYTTYECNSEDFWVFLANENIQDLKLIDLIVDIANNGFYKH